MPPTDTNLTKKSAASKIFVATKTVALKSCDNKVNRGFQGNNDNKDSWGNESSR